MTTFRFSSIGPDGQRRTGRLEATSRDQARQLVSSNGELLIALDEVGARHWFRLERKDDLKPSVASEFALEISGLLKADASLRQALDIQANGKGSVARLAASLRRDIDAGRSLSEALRSVGGAGLILAEFASAGEEGAGLDSLLGGAGRFLAARQSALEKIRAALAYPLFILALTVIAACVIIVYVSPALAPTLKDAGQGGLIISLAAFGSYIQAHATYILLSVAAVVFAIFLLLKQDTLQKRLNRWFWQLPILGRIARDLDTGQSCNVMAALLESGRPMEVALQFAGAVSGPELAQSYKSIAQDIRDGEVASSAFANHPELPLEVRRLARLGERSSTFGQAIGQAGELCHARALRAIEKLAAVTGPVLVIGLGAAVSLMMISVLGSLASIADQPL